MCPAPTARSASPPPPLRLSLLGHFVAERNGRVLPAAAWERRRAVELLQLLAIAPARRAPRDQIIDALWPDKDPASGANNLHRALHDLRKVIGADSVRADKGILRLGDDVWIDVAEFEHLAAADELEKAVALYRGDLCADGSCIARIEIRREQLRQKFAEIAVRAAKQKQVVGQHRQAAIDLLRRVLEVEPANEEAHRLLMRALSDAGRRAEALRQYGECERVFREQLESTPSPETRQLYELLAKTDPAPRRTQTTGWERVARRLLGSPVHPAMRGRADVQAVLRDFAESPSGVLLLVGEAGIGKTHAAVEGARLAGARDALLMCGAALEFERSAPYAPFVEAWSDQLRLTGLGPEENPFLAFSASPNANPQEDKLRLFQTVQRSIESLAGGRPVYFVLDDLHFADESTLHLFHYLARVARTMPLLLVGTCREEELATNEPLHALVSNLYRERLGKRIVLNRLDGEATRQLVQDRIGEPIADKTLRSIYRLTEGNPFFTEEVVHSMKQGDTPAVTADLASVIVERVERLGLPVEQLLTAGAVMGQTFEYELARQVAGLQDTALEALELSLGAKLIEEDDQRYRFRHGLVRESLYQRVSRVRRVELHRRVANTIEQISRDRVEDLAFHLRAAGEPARAFPYLVEAGRRAATRLGFGEAVSFYQQALAAMETLKLPPDEQRFKVLLRMGQMNFSLSNLEAAVQQLDAAASLYREPEGWRPSPSDRAKARRCAALALITAGDLAEANVRLESAMADLADQPESSEYPHVLYHLAQLRWHEGRHHDAHAVAERCLREAERQGDPNVIAKGYEILSLSCHSLGEWKSGIEFEERRRALVGSAVDVAQAFDVHL